jgi:hypothetical protein
MDKEIIASGLVWREAKIIKGHLFSAGELVDPSKYKWIIKYISKHPDSVCSKIEYNKQGE